MKQNISAFIPPEKGEPEKDLSGTTIAEDGRKPSSDSSGFVLLSEAVPDAVLEIRYYSTCNFMVSNFSRKSGGILPWRTNRIRIPSLRSQ